MVEDSRVDGGAEVVGGSPDERWSYLATRGWTKCVIQSDGAGPGVAGEEATVDTVSGHTALRTLYLAPGVDVAVGVVGENVFATLETALAYARKPLLGEDGDRVVAYGGPTTEARTGLIGSGDNRDKDPRDRSQSFESQISNIGDMSEAEAKVEDGAGRPSGRGENWVEDEGSGLAGPELHFAYG